MIATMTPAEYIALAEKSIAEALGCPEPTGRQRTYWVNQVRARLLRARSLALTVKRRIGSAKSATDEESRYATHLLDEIDRLWPLAITSRKSSKPQSLDQPGVPIDANTLYREWLHRERKQRGVSLEALQRSSGINLGLLSRLERGQRQFSAHPAVRVLRALGVTRTEFLAIYGVKIPPTYPPISSLQDLGLFIRKTRLNYSLSQQDFAKMLDVSSMTLLRIEYGQRKVQLALIVRIGQILGITAELLSMLWDFYSEAADRPGSQS